MQTIAHCHSANGEIQSAQLDHRKDDVQGFHSQFSGKVIVGLESGGYSSWFEGMLEELGHTVWTGHATEIRLSSRLAREERSSGGRIDPGDHAQKRFSPESIATAEKALK
jgi:hypothetical protein